MLENIKIILIETSHSGNVGAVARAMKNMGVHQLVLVSPRCVVDETAIRRSSGATDILDNLVIVDTLDEAVADCVHVFGASSRKRKIEWPLMTARESAKKAVMMDRNPLAFVFGREDRGLDNIELTKCHTHLSIPADDVYASLNLAMAVQIVCYELRMGWLESYSGSPNIGERSTNVYPVESEGWDDEPATWKEVDSFYGHLEETMTAIGYYDPSNPRKLMPRLKRLYSRAGLGKMEINILRGICKATLKLTNLNGSKQQ